MSRITLILIVGILVIALSFAAFSFGPIEFGLLSALKDIPFFSSLIDIGENYIGVETGISANQSHFFRDFVNLLLLTILISIIDKSVEWVMDAFDAEKSWDKSIVFLDKIVWKFIISMLCIVLNSFIIGKVFDLLYSKIGKIAAFALSIVILLLLFAVIFFIESKIRNKDMKFVILKNFIFTFIKAVIMLWIYAVIFMIIKTGSFHELNPILITFILLCFAAQAVTGIITKQYDQKVNKK